MTTELPPEFTEATLLATKDVAHWLGVPPGTVAQWRHNGRGPAYIKLSTGSIRYRPEVVAQFIRDREVTTSESSGRPVEAAPVVPAARRRSA